MGGKKRALWFKARMPGAVRDGTSTVTLNLVDCLAKAFDVDLITMRINGNEDALAASICPPFKNVTILEPENAGSLVRRAVFRAWYTVVAWWRGVPRAVLYASGRRARATLRERFERERYDLAVFEYYTSAPLLPLANCPTALILIDATFQTLADASAGARGLRGWGARRSVEIMRRFECRMAAGATICFAISPRDVELLRGAGNPHPIEHLPVVFPPLPNPDASHEAACRTPRVCFMGSLRYPENRKALLWFLDDVWPRVLLAVPSAELVVIGGGEECLPEPTRSSAGVRYAGWVEDLPATLATCCCGVAPSVSGTGVKIKVLDMLWHGLPVVATTIAAAGTPAAKGAACVADSPVEFAKYVVDLLSSRDARERLQAAARGGMQAGHCGPAVRESIVSRFEAVARE